MQVAEHRGYRIRYHNNGAGWFAHIYRPGAGAMMKDGLIKPIPGETKELLLARARARIDAEELANAKAGEPSAMEKDVRQSMRDIVQGRGQKDDGSQ